MEKEKKVKEIKKVEEDIVIDNREKIAVKVVALTSTFFATILAQLLFVFSVIACVSIANMPKEDLVNNNIVVTVISKMNNYSVAEVRDLINSMTNRFAVIFFEIIIPTLAFVGSMILILILAKRIIEFIDDINYEKDLYNKRKLVSAQDIITILSVVLLATLVIFNRPTIIVYLLIEVLLLIIYYLFKKCIIFRKK